MNAKLKVTAAVMTSILFSHLSIKTSNLMQLQCTSVQTLHKQSSHREANISCYTYTIPAPHHPVCIGSHWDPMRLAHTVSPSGDKRFREGQLPSGLFRAHSGPARPAQHAVTLLVFDKGQMNPGVIGGAL